MFLLLVPQPAVTVSTDNVDQSSLIEATYLDIVCTVNSYYQFESTLMFLPIDNGDHNNNFNDIGKYTCQITISSSDPLIIIGINSTTDTITVQCKLLFLYCIFHFQF